MPLRALFATMFAAWMLLFVAAVPAGATVFVFVETDQAGANTTIDVDHTTSIAFTAASAWTLGGGNFTMKDGSQTSASITLAVYSIANNVSILLQSVTLTKTQFCAAAAVNCQTYASRSFVLPAPVTFTTGMNYFVALTSPASTSGAEQYFIKGLGSTVLVDPVGGATPPTQTFTFSENTPVPPAATVPEPATMLLLACGMLGLGIGRHRRRRAA